MEIHVSVTIQPLPLFLTRIVKELQQFVVTNMLRCVEEEKRPYLLNDAHLNDWDKSCGYSVVDCLYMWGWII